MIKIDTYRYPTGLGQSFVKLPFLNVGEHKLLNEVGFSGKLNGFKVSREEYLNSLDKGVFKVVLLRGDNGDFSEDYMIIHAYETKGKK